MKRTTAAAVALLLISALAVALSRPAAKAQGATPGETNVLSAVDSNGHFKLGQAAKAAPQAIKVPAGKYTSLVFSGIGIPPSEPVTVIVTAPNGTFGVAVGPGTTSTIPFGDGWDVKDGDVSITVQLLGHNTPTQVFVFGTTANGFVPFPH